MMPFVSKAWLATRLLSNTEADAKLSHHLSLQTDGATGATNLGLSELGLDVKQDVSSVLSVLS